MTYWKKLAKEAIQERRNFEASLDSMTDTTYHLLKQGKAVPPLDVLCTDANDSVVFRWEWSSGNKIVNLGPSDGLRLDSLRYPLTVTITDKDGKTWEWEISEPKEKIQ